MPLSAKERMRKYRANLTEEKRQEVKARNAAQQKKCRMKWNTKNKKNQARKSAIRMQKSREARKHAMKESNYNTTASPSTAFGSVQSFGRAMSKAKKALPRSPRKRAAVIRKLSFGVPTQESSLPSGQRTNSSNEVLYKKVVEFYESDLISRQLPGKKDFVKIKRPDGTKQHKQKRVLMMTILEAHRVFVLDFPEMKIGKTKFAELRPQHVVPISDKDHTVCCCRYHENVELLLRGLHKVKPTIPVTADALVNDSVCSWNMTCLFGECPYCSNIDDYVEKLLGGNDDHDNNTEIQCAQWNSQTKKEVLHMDISEASAELVCQLRKLRQHCFLAKYQLQQIKYLKTHLSDTEAVLHEDFSENYNIKQQREVMSAHWISNSVTIFTAIIYRAVKSESYIVVSDSLHHDKYAVWSFNKVILSDSIEKTGLEISQLHIFSDGAASQFKNRYILSTLLTPRDVNPGLQEMDWSFFETAHGKGPIDGLGGTVKRAVWRRTLQERVVIHNAEEFAVCAKDACPNINVLFISADTIAELSSDVKARWEAASPRRIPSTHKLHYVKASGSCHLCTSPVSPFTKDIHINYEVVQLFDTPSDSDEGADTVIDAVAPTTEPATGALANVKIGSYVKLQYDGQYYPGKVLNIDGSMYTVKAMEKCRGGWRWPSCHDICTYPEYDVLQIISDPRPVNNRGVFRFPDDSF